MTNVYFAYSCLILELKNYISFTCMLLTNFVVVVCDYVHIATTIVTVTRDPRLKTRVFILQDARENAT